MDYAPFIPPAHRPRHDFALAELGARCAAALEANDRPHRRRRRQSHDLLLTVLAGSRARGYRALARYRTALALRQRYAALLGTSVSADDLAYDAGS